MQSTRINFLSSLCFMGLVVASTAQSSCGVVGESSQIICVTRTTFKLDNADETIFSCPTGLFCADVPEVCTSVGLAACNTAKICRQCLPNSISSCVDSKKYVMCESGQLAGNEKYCQASKPYCSMQYDANGVANSVCTNVIGDIACDGTTTPPPPTDPPTTPTPTDPPTRKPCKKPKPTTPKPCVTPPPTNPCETTPPPPTNPPPTTTTTTPIPPTTPDPNSCINLGKYPIIGDVTCKRYYYCFMNAYNQIQKEEFVCPYTYLYNPIKGKCVTESGSFKCIH